MATYVLGFDELGRLIVMADRDFDDCAQAQAYADGVARGWRAFAVQAVPSHTKGVDDFKAIANELFDMLTDVNERLQGGLMGDMSGRLTMEIPGLLERVECVVKDK